MASSDIINEAVRDLAARHRPMTHNEYGRTVVAGFSVVAGRGGAARISHTTPQADLTDPERPSDDEVAAARHRMVNAYAQTLMEAGWSQVERRGLQSRYPYLLASGAPRAAAETCGRTECISGKVYPPCVRDADHREAYCRSASGDLFLAPGTGRP